jgi:general secretion pathway protein C
MRGGALQFLPRVLDLALVAALAATLAWWTWALAAPAAVAASSYAAPAAPASGDGARLRNLFGAPAAATPAAGPLRLVGVASPRQAIFALQGEKPRAARPGEEIVPGTILREVHRDHAVVERAGVLERLSLERTAAGRDARR